MAHKHSRTFAALILGAALFIVVASCSDMIVTLTATANTAAKVDAAALSVEDFSFASGDSATAVTASFSVPISGEINTTTTISWTATPTGIITIDDTTGTATVSRPTTATEVTLTATITDAGGNTTTKTIIVSVIGQSGDATIALEVFAGTYASAGFVNAAGTSAKFSFPQGITSNATHLFVVEDGNHTVRSIEIATGTVTTLAGTGTSGNSDGTGPAASFNRPSGITRLNETLFVTDNTNNRIRKITISTGAVVTIAGSSSGILDNTTGTSAKFNFPTNSVSDSDGTYLYVSDTMNQSIRRVSLTAPYAVTTVGSFGSNTFGIALVSADRLFVTNYDTGVAKWVTISDGAMTPLTTTFDNPADMFFNSVDGYVYLVEQGLNQVRKINPTSGAVFTISFTTPAGIVLSNLGGVCIVGSTMYLTDWVRNVIYRGTLPN